ncbi:hypothetical protein [Acidovorax sp. FG27]|uniref:hypothetical protein n=1 Tax=Acidovorax sp. FG27 TaxID=3133652 RepID=UPI0030E87226
MKILNLSNLQFPLTPHEVIAQNPDKSFPDPFEMPDGYVWVLPSDPPSVDPLTHSLRCEAAQDGEGWREKWTSVPLSPGEAAIAAQRHRGELLRAVSDKAQRRLDEFAQQRRYDGIVSLASYASSKNARYAAEGQRGVDLRDEVWSVLREIESSVLSSTRPVPTFEEAIAELPEMTWAPALT